MNASLAVNGLPSAVKRIDLNRQDVAFLLPSVNFVHGFLLNHEPIR
jgi:hypothetical protein